MTARLRREGVTAGRHRIRRLMPPDGDGGDLAGGRRTSVASPEHRVFPYLLREPDDLTGGPCRQCFGHHLVSL